jgi:MFS family permease
MANIAATQSPQMEPLTFGMILDRTIHLYLRNFVLLFGIMLLPQSLNYANQLVFARSLQWSAKVATILYVLAYFLIYLLTFAAGTGAATVAISSRYLGRDTSVVAAYRQAVRKIGSIMGAWAVAGILSILVLLGSLVGIVIVWVALEAAFSERPWLLAGILLWLIIAGLLLAGWMLAAYSLITPAIIVENCNPRQSRRRSRFLTKRSRFRILGIYFLYLIVILMVTYGSLLVANLITGTDPMLLFTGKLTYIHRLVSAPLQFLLAPIPAILIVLIYYNQRMHKEGFDLVVLAEALVEQ